jgi:hypothetical protein
VLRIFREMAANIPQQRNAHTAILG